MVPKGQLIPIPHPSESLEIMCMRFILSGPRTSLHIFNHINYKKFATKFSENEGGGRVEGRLEFFRKFIRFGCAILPLVILHSFYPVLIFTTDLVEGGES